MLLRILEVNLKKNYFKDIIMAVKPEEFNFARNEKFNLSMIPGSTARFLRTCKIWQFIRFVIINIKMIIVVGKSH